MPDESQRPWQNFDPTNWRLALAAWERDQRASHADVGPSELCGRIPMGWWEAAFAAAPTRSERQGHPCGAHQMLIVVAYDITDERRLRKIATLCEDYGLRVQYSVFECRLETHLFDQFWNELRATIDSGTDRLVAYKVCAACAREIRDAGLQTHQQKVAAYVF
jgi:CRISPR-associated protein Cas2